MSRRFVSLAKVMIGSEEYSLILSYAAMTSQVLFDTQSSDFARKSAREVYRRILSPAVLKHCIQCLVRLAMLSILDRKQRQGPVFTASDGELHVAPRLLCLCFPAQEPTNRGNPVSERLDHMKHKSHEAQVRLFESGSLQ